MKKLLTITFCAAVLVGAFALLVPPPAAAAPRCPKGQVACYNCNGTFAYCARSHAFCPECPAP